MTSKARSTAFGTLALALTAALGEQAAQACSVCFGDPNSALVKGAASGILVLMGVIGCVLCGFVSLGGYWMIRARRLTLAQKSDRDDTSRSDSQ